jgi:hypothetical protein
VHVVVPGLVCDGTVSTVWNQVNDVGHTKLVTLDRKREVDNAVGVVVQDPDKRRSLGVGETKDQLCFSR